MKKFYCCESEDQLYRLARDIILNRDVDLVVPSVKYVHKSVETIRDAVSGMPKTTLLEVRETSDSASIKLEIDFGRKDVYTIYVYTINSMRTESITNSKYFYRGVYFYKMSECLSEYAKTKGYTNIVAVYDTFPDEATE